MGKICYEAFMDGEGPSWEDATPRVRAKFERVGERIQREMGGHCLASAKALDTHRNEMQRSMLAASGVAGF